MLESQREPSLKQISSTTALIIGTSAILASCSQFKDVQPADDPSDAVVERPMINPENWPVIETAPLDPKVEAQIDLIMEKMTLEQKVGQVKGGWRHRHKPTPDILKIHFI